MDVVIHSKYQKNYTKDKNNVCERFGSKGVIALKKLTVEIEDVAGHPPRKIHL